MYDKEKREWGFAKMKNSSVALIIVGIFALVTVAYGFYVLLYDVPVQYWIFNISMKNGRTDKIIKPHIF